MRNSVPEVTLDSSLLARTTSIVWNRSTVFDQLHIQAGGLKRGDCAFTSGAWPLDADFDFLHAKLLSLLSGLLRSTLTSERRTLTTSLETGGSGARPAQRITFRVRDRNGRVVKCRLNMSDTNCHITSNSSLLRLRHEGELL